MILVLLGVEHPTNFFLTVYNVIPLMVSKITPISFNITARITHITVLHHHEPKPKKKRARFSDGGHFQHLRHISPAHWWSSDIARTTITDCRSTRQDVSSISIVKTVCMMTDLFLWPPSTFSASTVSSPLIFINAHWWSSDMGRATMTDCSLNEATFHVFLLWKLFAPYWISQGQLLHLRSHHHGHLQSPQW